MLFAAICLCKSPFDFADGISFFIICARTSGARLPTISLKLDFHRLPWLQEASGGLFRSQNQKGSEAFAGVDDEPVAF